MEKDNHKQETSFDVIEGAQKFKEQTLINYPEIKEFWNVIEDFIKESDCKKIEIENIKLGIAVSLFNGVIFNERIFNQPLTSFLFSVFHEMAHQYQYKKYGADKMTSFYSDDLSVNEAAKFMYDTEVTADQFATRKLRELQKYGHLKNLHIPQGYYKRAPIKQFETLIQNVKSALPNLRNANPEKINEILYNWIKFKTSENI